METFDDISCEEYAEIYEEREEFEAWVAAMEQEELDTMNRELRLLAAA